MSDTALLNDPALIRDTKTAQKFLDAGIKAEGKGDRIAAIEAYEAAFTADPDLAEVCFRLAYNLDLVGEEEEALHLYEQAVMNPNPHLNVLINLAIMYEDQGQYAKAERCLRQVLATDPNHARAQLYMKDIMASKAMVIEDEEQPITEVSKTLLETPITDFELSVRTRNALRKMNIRTLGDLLRLTEAEIRGFKNFGDQSLDEIKTMLAQRGLKLGQVSASPQAATRRAVYDQLQSEGGADAAVLDRTVNELNLSVRARKALSLLSISTVGELCGRTEAELMGVKNFGMTSLLEIKEKLADLGLSLRQLEENA